MAHLGIGSALAAAVLLALAGCSKNENKNEGEGPYRPSAAEGSEQPNPPAEYVPEPPQVSAKLPGELNDPEIAKITDVVNSGEIKQGELAQSRAHNPNVQLFASMMVADHSQAKQNAGKLMVQERMIPEESGLATELADSTQQTLQSLQTGDTASFDNRYIDAQVEQHQAVLDLLDKQLIPAAQNPELKAELDKTRGMVQRHLDQAKQIQAALATVPE